VAEQTERCTPNVVVYVVACDHLIVANYDHCFATSAMMSGAPPPGTVYQIPLNAKSKSIQVKNDFSTDRFCVLDN
jgi:hypothetical protein